MNNTYLTNEAYKPTMGFGAVFQEVLNNYFLCLYHPEYKQTKFVFSPFSELIAANHHNKSQKEWDDILNILISNILLPRQSILLLSDVPNSTPTVHVSKSFLDDIVVRHNPGWFDHLKTHFNDQTKYWPTYFDKEWINIAIHIRVYSNIDTEHEASAANRFLYKQGNNTDKYFQTCIKQIADIVGSKKVHFHLYSQFTDFNHYQDLKTKDTIKISSYQGTDLISDLFHMIKADIFIASLSSLSAIVNYYREKPTICRPGFWHPLYNVVYSEDGIFSDSQKEHLNLSDNMSH